MEPLNIFNTQMNIILPSKPVSSKDSSSLRFHDQNPVSVPSSQWVSTCPAQMTPLDVILVTISEHSTSLQATILFHIHKYFSQNSFPQTLAAPVLHNNKTFLFSPIKQNNMFIMHITTATCFGLLYSTSPSNELLKTQLHNIYINNTFFFKCCSN
jgi:hypothetical protein